MLNKSLMKATSTPSALCLCGRSARARRALTCGQREDQRRSLEPARVLARGHRVRLAGLSSSGGRRRRASGGPSPPIRLMTLSHASATRRSQDCFRAGSCLRSPVPRLAYPSASYLHLQKDGSIGWPRPRIISFTAACPLRAPRCN